MSKIQEIKNLIIDNTDFEYLTIEQAQFLDNFFNSIESSYVLSVWPESQDLMNESWFNEEAVLDVEGKFGSSAYFIPIERVL